MGESVAFAAAACGNAGFCMLLAMPKPPRLAILLLSSLAVVASGCGSTETASTSSTTPTNASPSAPASPQTVSTSTSPAKAQPTTTAAAPKVAEAEPKHQESAAEAKPESKAEAPKPSAKATPSHVPVSRQYPKPMQSSFIAACKAWKGSASSCECLLASFEMKKVEKAQSLAELLATEGAMRTGRALPRRLGPLVAECNSQGA